MSMIKQCGNCEFWDREHRMGSGFSNKNLAECKFPTPACVSKTKTYDDSGKDCPVYKEKL